MFNFIETEKDIKPAKENIQKPFSLVTRIDSYMYEGYNQGKYNPDLLYEKKGNYDLFDEMRRDDQIYSVLNLRKFILLSPDWTIECEDEKVVDFITWNLENSLDEIFIKKLYNVLTCMDFGFSLTERVFARQGNKIILKDLKTRSPHSFDFEQDEYGKIQKVIQYVTDGEIEIDISKFMHFPYQQEFDNPYGKSVLNNGVYRAYWSKSAIIKFWNIYLERHGMPLGVGTYPNTSGDAAREKFEKIGKNLSAKTFVTFPQGYELDFKEATKDAGSYEKAIDKYNMMISRALLVPDLMGFGGAETGGGSYSLGEKQFDMFYAVVEFDRKQIERLVTKSIVNPLVQYNFGNVEAKFVFKQVDEERKMDLLKMWLESVKTGKIPITDLHINWFLKSIEAPAIEQKELDRISLEKKEQQEAIQSGIEQKSEEKPEEKKEKPIEKKKPEKKTKEKPIEQKQELTRKEYAFSSFRDLTDYEKKENFTQIEEDLNKNEDKYVTELSDWFTLVINALADEIKRKKIIEKKKFSLINKLDLKYQAQINKIIKSMLDGSMKDGKKRVEKNYIIENSDVLNNDDLAAWTKQHAFYVTDMEAGFILGKTKVALSEGIRAGDSVRDIMATLDDVLKGYDIELGAPRVETIVRTNINAAYNEGRAQQFDEISGEIQAYQYSAIMDGRTSDVCSKLDKKIFKPSELSYYNPPNHFNCRSLVIPIFKDEKLKRNPPPSTKRDPNAGGNFLVIDKGE